MSCGGCQRVRSHLPAAIRKRLEEVERRIAAKRSRVQINYTTTPGLPRTDPPRQTPEIPPGGGSAGGAGT